MAGRFIPRERMPLTTKQEGWVGPTAILHLLGKTKISRFRQTSWKGGVAIVTDMRRLTTGIRSEKCVVKRFRRCANVIDCTYTNLESIAVWYNLLLLGYKPVQHVTVLWHNGIIILWDHCRVCGLSFTETSDAANDCNWVYTQAAFSMLEKSSKVRTVAIFINVDLYTQCVIIYSPHQMPHAYT
jgi:hypothetical protein